MNTSVGTKTRKKQSSLSAALPVDDQRFEQALLSLEGVCARILQSRFPDHRQYSEQLYWQQKLKNITTPISLALAEYKGPRRFHNHYRHREDDEAVLTPVLESPIDMLAQVCLHALEDCRSLVGVVQAPDFSRNRDMLEQALQYFLGNYRESALL